MGGSSTGGAGVGVEDAGTFETNEAGSLSPDAGSSGGFGQWHFDDCSPKSNFLVDSSGEGANAQHALKSACVPGVSGLGVEFRTVKDVVQVPDEPQFTVDHRVAVAAWVHPTTVTGDHPIVLKRLGSETSFSLGIHNGNIQMSVVLTTGQTIISQAPITSGTWTHVAGMYDGTFVFLFINGQQFGQVYAGGTLRDVFAPIRIGATTQSQYFDGIIDEVFVSTEPITSQMLTALACTTQPNTFQVSASTTAAVPFDTNVHYDITVANNNIGACGPQGVELFVQSPAPTLNVSSNNPFQVVSPGGSADFGVDVSATEDADPGVDLIPFSIESFGETNFSNFQFLSGQLSFDLAKPTGCFVSEDHELMITDTSVVDDPARTFGVFDPPFVGFSGDGGGEFVVDARVGLAVPTARAASSATSPTTSTDSGNAPIVNSGVAGNSGVWTFGQLMRAAAPTPDQAPAMTLQLFQHWLADQTVNGFTVSARPAMQSVLLDVWPKTADGALDLDQAPLRLQAIVDRIDLRNLSAGSAGEGRFVFAVNGPGGVPQSFTVILEYNLPAQTEDDVQSWANQWHALSSHPFPSEEYNTALEAITRRFAGRNAGLGAVNGSNLIQLRTNEIALSFQWELRTFALSPTTGFFDEVPDPETPDLSFNGTPAFANFVNQNAAAIIAEVPGANGNIVPPKFGGQNFRAGSVFNNQIEWSAPGIINPDARFHASLNTCNGCHGPESGTFSFTIISPRTPGQVAILSPFLTGTTVFDRFSGQARTLNDLSRRRTDLTSLACPSDGGTTTPPFDAGSTTTPPFDAGSTTTPPFDAGTIELDAGTCVPTSCAAAGIGCGPTGDGCGNVIDCGSCPSPQICGLIAANECGDPSLLPDGGTTIPPASPTPR